MIKPQSQKGLTAMLFDYFTNSTHKTYTGAKIGSEVETDMVTSDGYPIGLEVTHALLNTTEGRPVWCEQKLELGRQKIELAIDPQPSQLELLEKTLAALEWFYSLAAQHGAYPRFEPDLVYSGELLYVAEERDAIWVELDGRPALEELCRCSSVQFTIDVNPYDAIELVNILWREELHQVDFVSNDWHWRRYIEKSAAGYLLNRYAGPEGFVDLEDYCYQLSKNLVVMHEGKPCGQALSTLTHPDIDLFLRSVWWHYRLRRYGDSLAVEIRPFSRRDDEGIAKSLRLITDILGL